MTTTAMVRRSASGAIAIPPTLALPPLPPAVAAHITAVATHADALARHRAASPDEREAMHVGLAPTVPRLSAGDVAAADRALDALARELAPVPLETLRTWLGPVNAACRNPQSQEDFEVRCFGLHALLDDLPNGAFTADARRALPAFFPSAEDVRAAVQPGANRLLATKTALAASIAASAKPADTGRQEPVTRTAEEIAAVSAKVRAFVAEVSDREAQQRRPAADRPATLSEGALMEHYRRLAENGNKAAAFRVQAYEAAGGAHG